MGVHYLQVNRHPSIAHTLNPVASILVVPTSVSPHRQKFLVGSGRIELPCKLVKSQLQCQHLVRSHYILNKSSDNLNPFTNFNFTERKKQYSLFETKWPEHAT